MTQPLQDTLWWVIPNQLAGVRKPVIDELPVLKAAGIRAIVSVMDDPSNLDVYAASNIPHCWLPTVGGQAPTHEQVETFCQFVDRHHQTGGAVAVHCSSGRRRTATFLAAFLISQGARYEEALDTIARANPQVEMRDAQLNFLKWLASP
jgi:protein-tyrosine phosphatase